MGSLFDVADGIFQSKNATTTKPTLKPAYSKYDGSSDVPTLFLLDDTLRQIQDSRAKSASTCYPRQANNPNNDPKVGLPEPWKYKGGSASESKLEVLTKPTRQSNHPLRRVFSNILPPSGEHQHPEVLETGYAHANL